MSATSDVPPVAGGASVVAEPQSPLLAMTMMEPINNGNGQPSSPVLKNNLSSSSVVVNDDMMDRRSTLHFDLQYASSHACPVGQVPAMGTSLRGLLTFALRYDHIHRVLMVHVLKAGGLTLKVLNYFD